MLRFVPLAALLVAATPTVAGAPTPLTIQIDRTQEPNVICANRLTSASGCMPIGTMDRFGNFTPYRNGAPLPPSETVVCGTPGTPITLPLTTSVSLYTVSDCSNAVNSGNPLIVKASSDANIDFNPATGQFGSFASVSLTIPGQSQTFYPANGLWAVK